MTSQSFRRCLQLVAFLFITSQTSQVQAASDTQQSAEASSVSVRDFASSLARALAADDLWSALALLDARPDISESADGIRLKAALLARLGRNDEAMALLEGWMAENGADALARFQVGEIHFAAGRLGPARLSYRLALSGALDPVRGKIVQDRLAAIETARNLRVSVTVSVAPDSNLNSATSAGTIDLFGLPFTLSEDARRQSGVTASMAVGVERRWLINEAFSIQAGGSLSILDAPNRAFDQHQLNLFIGPELRSGIRRSISAAVTYREIGLGGAPFESAHGIRVSGTAYPDAQTGFAATAYLDRIDNRFGDSLDGWSFGGQLSRTRYLGPNALWRASLTTASYDLVGAEADYSLVQIAAGRLTSLPFGVSAYVEPYVRRRAFERSSTVFGVRRDDRELGLTLRLSKRNLIVHGAFPYVQGVTSKSWSNVSLGDYSRQRFEFGLTRDF